MIYKKILIVIIIIIAKSTSVMATNINNEVIKETQNNFGINDFIKETKKYSGEVLENTDISMLLNSAISGKVDNSTILKKIINVFGKEILKTIKTLVGILVIVLIHSILKSISDGLENSNITKIIYYVQYILIVTLIMNNFSDLLKSISNTISNLVGFMNLIIPILMGLMIYTGSIATTGMLEPIILFIVDFIANIIIKLILPTISIITALIIIAKISDKVQIGKLANLMKSSIIWFLGVVLTVFVGVVSIEGTLASSVDGITAKTAKTAVSTLIPVVGKILGDSVDSVLGCGLILKNAIGVVGVIIIIGICVMPIIKLTTFTIIYSITSAIIEPIADEKIVKLLEEFSGIFKILLAVVCSVSVLLIVGITLFIRISNNGMMYR